MKKTFITFIVIIIQGIAFSQTCPPNGIIIETQLDIDNFPINYPECTQISQLFIRNSNDIVNLDGLEQIEIITSVFEITENQLNFDLNGFNSLISIGESFLFSSNFGSFSISGFNSLTNIDGSFEITENEDIGNISGFNNLSSVGSFFSIQGNNLNTISGFNSLSNVLETFEVSNNMNLTTISGFTNLNNIQEYFQIARNPDLSSISGFNMLSTVGMELEINDNDALINLIGFSMLSNINQLIIINNDNLTNLSGLNSGLSVTSSINIVGNTFLGDCATQSICNYLNGGGAAYFSNNSSGCNNQVEVETSCSVLPVALVSFEGRLINQRIRLNWITVSELNNLGFEIQKSKNGRDWQILDFIQGDGTSNLVNEYEYQDSNPFSGINYYRLKHIDYDGVFEYSKVISVTVRRENEIEIYPNPTNGRLEIVGVEMAEIKIIDSSGRVVKELMMSNGNIEISELSKGLYFISVKTGKGVITKLIIKE